MRVRICPVSNLEPHRITVGNGAESRSIAYHLRLPSDAAKPALVWLGGYGSDMSGTKALELDRYAEALGAACLRHDYSGHGASGGAFRDGTISRWVEESLAVLDHVGRDAPGFNRLVLVGSSMGAWIALRMVEELRKRGEGGRLAGLVLIAPAPDFTLDLIEPHLTEDDRAVLADRGFMEEASLYGSDPVIYTVGLIEDGRKNRVMAGIIETGCPVHILQGMADPDVPYAHALKLMEHLPADDLVMTLIADGDHRLSRPEDLERMRAALDGLLLD